MICRCWFLIGLVGVAVAAPAQQNASRYILGSEVITSPALAAPVSVSGTTLIFGKVLPNGRIEYFEQTPQGSTSLNARLKIEVSDVSLLSPSVKFLRGRLQSTNRIFTGIERNGQLESVFQDGTGVVVTPNGLSGDNMLYGTTTSTAVLHDLNTGQQVNLRLNDYNSFEASDGQGTYVLASTPWDELRQGLYLYKDNTLRGVGPFKRPSMNRSGQMAMLSQSGEVLYYWKDNRYQLLWGEGGGKQFGQPTLTHRGTIFSENSDLPASRIWDGTKLVSIEEMIDGNPYDKSRYQLQGGIIDRDTDQIYATLQDRQGIEPYRIIRLDPVPEPGTLAALGLGLAAVLRRRRPKA